MRTLITSLVILVFSSCILFAQNMVKQREEQDKGPGNQKGITIKLPPMMSNIVQDILTKASSLDLSNSQEKELSEIGCLLIWQSEISLILVFFLL